MLIPRPGLQMALRQALSRSPSVALLGARQVGKTTLARQLAHQLDGTLYLDLEKAADLRKLEEAEPFLRAQIGRLTVLDEVRYAPHLFTELRGIIDLRREAGERSSQFLLLGSKQGGRPRLAIEVKRSSAPKVEAGFSIACDDLGIEHRLVVGSGRDSYRARGNVTVHSLESALDVVRKVLESPFATR